MPLSKIQLRPGINKEGTTYSNEGGYYSCDKIRFRSGYAEKLGGWINQAFGFTFKGVARTLFNWVTYDGSNLLAVGTSNKYYVQFGVGGAYYDVTPLVSSTATTLGANPIATVNGSRCVTITTPLAHGTTPGTYVTLNGYGSGTIAATVLTITSTVSGGFAVGQTISGTGVTVGTTIVSLGTGTGGVGTYNLSTGSTVATAVAITGSVSVGGITISGEYEVVSTPTTTSFTISSTTTATSTVASGGGSGVTVTYQISAGGTAAVAAYGWGYVPWSSGGWSSPATTGTSILTRLWSQDLFEQDIIFNQSNAGIYYWTYVNPSTFNRAVTLAAKCNSEAKVTLNSAAPYNEISFGTPTTTVTVISIDGIDVGSYLVGTGILANTTVVALLSATSVQISQNTTAASSGIYTFSYVGSHAPDRTYCVLASDTSHFTMVFGSKPYDPSNFNPTFDPMMVRWSDQGNPYEWVPSVTNQAGEQHLSNGSYLVTAVNTRQEILVWSDAAVYNMQYIGPPYVWNFTLIGDNTSIASINSAISVNTVVYWMGIDKFYMYNGRLETLSSTIWKYVYDNFNKTKKDLVVSGSNEGFSEVWWFYPSLNSNVNDSYVIYNYLEQTWYYGTLNRSAWLDSPLRQYPLAAFSVQNSYLASAIGTTDTLITLVDITNYPIAGTLLIDSEQITYTGISGNNLTGCVRGANGTTAASHVIYAAVAYTVANQVLYHEYGNDDQSSAVALPISAYLESSDFDIGDGNNFGFVWRVIPDITFRGSTGASPRVILTLRARSYTTPSTTAVQDGLAGSASGSPYVDEGTTPSTVTRTSSSSATVETYTSEVFTRIRARQATFRVDSNTEGTAWQVGAMRIDVRQDGRR